jgi:hypothetical protein
MYEQFKQQVEYISKNESKKGNVKVASDELINKYLNKRRIKEGKSESTLKIPIGFKMY